MNVGVRILLLSVGGALGVNARYWLGVWFLRWSNPNFPWATFTINLTGSFAIGFLSMALTHWLPHPHFRILVIVGFLGGYTTFSSLSLESYLLWETGRSWGAFFNTFGSLAGGMIAVTLGIALARAIIR